MSSTQTISRTLNPSIELVSDRPVATSTHQSFEPNDSFEPANPENIVEASRLNDAAVPDGGYGWVIVAVSSMLTFWFVGTSYSWGVIQAALLEKNVASASTLAFVGSLAIACNAAFAIPNSRILVAIGVRKLAIIGLLAMGIGQILSGFSERSIGGLFVTAGLMMGYGVRSVYKMITRF